MRHKQERLAHAAFRAREQRWRDVTRIKANARPDMFQCIGEWLIRKWLELDALAA